MFRHVRFHEDEDLPEPTRQAVAPLIGTCIITVNGVKANLESLAQMILFRVELPGRLEFGFSERVTAIAFGEVDGINPFRPPPTRPLEALVVGAEVCIVAPDNHALQPETPLGFH
jgi:hypothetical protein